MIKYLIDRHLGGLLSGFVSLITTGLNFQEFCRQALLYIYIFILHTHSIAIKVNKK